MARKSNKQKFIEEFITNKIELNTEMVDVTMALLKEQLLFPKKDQQLLLNNLKSMVGQLYDIKVKLHIESDDFIYDNVKATLDQTGYDDIINNYYFQPTLF